MATTSEPQDEHGDPAHQPHPARERSEATQAAVDVPFKVQPLTGKGLGLVATRRLDCGELILAEHPMLEYEGQGPAWLDCAKQRFSTLREPVQKEAFALQDAFAKAGGKKTFEGILRTNSLSRGVSADGLLCKLSSRLNHSCTPNCDWSWDDETREVRIYASTEISENQELCIHYIDLRAPRATRIRLLQDMYRFTCDCKACRRKGSPLESSDKRRERMGVLHDKLDAVGTKDAKMGIAMVNELMELYIEEGIDLKSFRKRACFYAFQFSLLIADHESAAFFVERAHEYSVLCHGSHHGQTRKLLKYMKDPHSHPAAGKWKWDVGMLLVRVIAFLIFLRAFWTTFGSGSGFWESW